MWIAWIYYIEICNKSEFLSHFLRVINKDIEYHKEGKVEPDEEIRIHDIPTIESLLRDTIEGTCTSETIRVDEYHYDFASECDWLMEDIPAIKSLKSPQKYSEHGYEHKEIHSYPGSGFMDMLVPVGMEYFQ